MRDQSNFRGDIENLDVFIGLRVTTSMNEKLEAVAAQAQRGKAEMIRLILRGELDTTVLAVGELDHVPPRKSRRACRSCEFFCANPDNAGTLDGECRKNPPTVTARASEFASVFADDWCGAYSPKAVRALP